MNRREFLVKAGAGAAVLGLAGCNDLGRVVREGAKYNSYASVPAYLKGYESLYAQDPRAAAQAWFKDARFGLFMPSGQSPPAFRPLVYVRFPPMIDRSAPAPRNPHHRSRPA